MAVKAAPHSGVIRSSRWLVAAAAILVLEGLGVIVYGAFLPVPEWMPSRVSIPLLGAPPIALVVLGTLSIGAGVGVLGVRSWGRVLGVAAAVAGLAYTVWWAWQAAPSGVGLADLLAAIRLVSWLNALLAGIVLFALLHRWPASTRSAAR